MIDRTIVNAVKKAMWLTTHQLNIELSSTAVIIYWVEKATIIPSTVAWDGAGSFVELWKMGFPKCKNQCKQLFSTSRCNGLVSALLNKSIQRLHRQWYLISKLLKRYNKRIAYYCCVLEEIKLVDEESVG